jgi:hypothetical protein
MDKNIQPVPIIYDQASVILPLDEDAFKDFIVSLLGQPETIEGKMKGSFEINIGDFQNINQLLDDRITTQNLSSLLEFRAKLFFNDDTSISFNGVQSFLEHNEMRPLICEGFIFTWSYLVKFHDKQASEKQEISISFINEEILNGSPKESAVVFSSDLSSVQTPKIIYSVRCTNKSWGIEITELIRKTLLILFKNNKSSHFRLTRKASDPPLFAFFVFLSLFVGNFYLGITIYRKVLIKLGFDTCIILMDKAKIYAEKTDKLEIEKKINLILQISSDCRDSDLSSSLTYVLCLIGSMTLSSFLTIKFFELIQPPEYHFILFTEESKKVRNEYFRKIKDKRIFWVVTILLSVLIGIISGVLGNYIFSFLTR